MPQKLSRLRIEEVSVVDHPANSSTDLLTGEKIPHARIALFKAEEEVGKYHPDQQRDNGSWTDGGAAKASQSANALSTKAKTKADHETAGVAHERASVAHRMAGLAAQQVGHDSASSAHEKAAAFHDQKAIGHYQKALGSEEGLRKFVDADESSDDLHELCKAVDGKTSDGETFPSGDFAHVPDEEHSSTWKLQIYRHGKPDARLVGAAVAALGKGFRGNRVSIPPDALPGVKAKVRAAWHAANPDSEDADLPGVLKKKENEEMPALSMDDVKKQLDGLADIKKKQEDLEANNVYLAKVNEEILKMSKTERKAFSSMSAEKRKEYMAADEKKRAAMMKEAADAMCEKRFVDAFDAATLAKFEKAGPEERKIMLADAVKKEEADLAKKEKEAKDKEKAGKKKAFPPKPAENDDGGDDDGPEEEDSEKMDKMEKTDVDALIAKRVDDAVAVLKSEHRAQIATLTDAVAKSTGTITAITKANRLLSFTKMVDRELPHLPGTSEERGETLMKMADAMGGEETELFKQYVATQKAADKILALGFREVGKDGGEQIPAMKVLDAKAAEIAKRDNISLAKAMTVACEENYEIFRDYEKAQQRSISA